MQKILKWHLAFNVFLFEPGLEWIPKISTSQSHPLGSTVVPDQQVGRTGVTVSRVGKILLRYRRDKVGQCTSDFDGWAIGLTSCTRWPTLFHAWAELAPSEDKCCTKPLLSSSLKFWTKLHALQVFLNYTYIYIYKDFNREWIKINTLSASKGFLYNKYTKIKKNCS